MNLQIPSHGISLRYARMAPDDGGGGGGAAPVEGASPDGAAPAGGAAAPPPAPRVEKVKMMVNGKEQEEDVPFEKLVAAYQKRSAADQTFREAAKTRSDNERIARENQELRSLILKDPLLARRQLAQRAENAETQEEFDEVAFLTDRLEAKLNEQDQLKDPRERALAEERRRRQELEQRIAKDEEAKTQREYEQKVAQRKEQFAETFTKALAQVKLPQNPFTMQAMARAFMDAKQHLPPGMKPTPEELAEATEADLAEVVEKTTEGLEGEALLSRYPNLTKRMFAALKARHQKVSGARQGVQQGSEPRPPPAPKPQQNQNGTRERTIWDLKTI